MNDSNNPIVKQYSTPNLFNSITNALKNTNKNLNEVTIKDLASVDFFHIRGHQSTKELANVCELTPNLKILDIGCGIGGTVRYLASDYGCYVTGLDIIDEYTKTASKLSELLKLNDKTEFKTGSAINLPFRDEMFDVVWTEHVQMNVKDKNKFYSEVYRVLKRGGKLVFHDVFSEKSDLVYYPVPWADDNSVSFLMEVSDVERLLKSFSYKISFWEDKTEISAKAFQKSFKKIKLNGFPPLGLQLLMGENTADKIKNMALNLSEKRLTVIQCVRAK
ncbi:MAG: class I SAM-dependent methyltransferase [Ignavibacteria bacterium]|nr:class I SAM-dependent methyltransferase [Ignavibacteria bacterium]MBT8382365.1 class I SAM-dependent methyltransferase [Ignavibacteria bacterium]MBT8390958.1 class I SAM-dependent methyltransferase [Ignavibacteria bacterium]NNJ52712.1 class I SAM-dependent methyltransferase [Ignavibacteriaceae bacterium]NNL21569.1 class I SAM-dependent methyltransferase [Ignavibacteriaceae bacterium]